MRPIFIIYIVTGLTALFGLANAGTHAYHIHATRYAITALEPDTEGRKRMQDVIDSDTGTVVWSSILATTQIMVCFVARKLKGAAHAA